MSWENLRQRLVQAWAKRTARPGFRKINEFLFDCAVHGLGILNYENDLISGELHFVKNLLPMYTLGRQPLIFDVGANEGGYARMVFRQFPQAVIYAFEPNPRTFAVLDKEFGSKINTINAGLGAAKSRLTLYDRADFDGMSQHASLYREVITDLHHAQSVEIDVDVFTVDDFVAEHGLTEPISLLKIDTEGHELEVLKGARKTIERGLVDLVHVEFNEMNVVSRVFCRDLREMLPDYVPFRLLQDGVLRLSTYPLTSELFAYQNIVFVNNRFWPNSAMEPTVRHPKRKTFESEDV